MFALIIVVLFCGVFEAPLSSIDAKVHRLVTAAADAVLEMLQMQMMVTSGRRQERVDQLPGVAGQVHVAGKAKEC